jgi:DNA replication and repair protein RecF
LRLIWIELTDLRNHRKTKLELPDGVIVVLGQNAEGKTNLLEGMFFLCSLSSPRVSSSEPLVRAGAEVAYVRGEAQTGEGRVLVEIEVPGAGANRVQVNRSPVRRKRDLRRRIRSVFFGPGDLMIVQGDPGERRGFMDEAIVALWPARESQLIAYDRVVRQRNRLLKTWEGSGAPPGLDAWDAELIGAGTAVTEARREVIERLGPHSSREFEAIAGYPMEVSYRPSVEGRSLPEAFERRLAERRADELVRRTTLVGPHRDDLHLGVRELTARGFASHGEAWAAALSLRLGLAAALEEEVGETPVLFLDDPFSAFDPVRRARMADRLRGRGQVFISTADEEHVPPSPDLVLVVSAGEVTVSSS